jgi:hypothetical protein
MSKFLKFIYGTAIVTSISAVILHIIVGESIVWPAIALFWITNSLFLDIKLKKS